MTFYLKMEYLFICYVIFLSAKKSALLRKVDDESSTFNGTFLSLFLNHSVVVHKYTFVAPDMFKNNFVRGILKIGLTCRGDQQA